MDRVEPAEPMEPVVPMAPRRTEAGGGPRSERGAGAGPSTFHTGSRLFLILLALSYACAYASLFVQVDGLFGVRGIEPLGEHLRLVEERYGRREGFFLTPSLLWFTGASTSALCALTGCGALLAALAVATGASRAPRLVLTLLWAGYVSLTSLGWPFLSFQWDALLCEAGLLGVFLAPWGWQPFAGRPAAGGRAAAPARACGTGPRLLVAWLCARLMFASGALKLLAEMGNEGQRPWQELKALEVHFWTQPLPTPLAVWANELPSSLLRIACALMFAIELGAPLAFVLGRRLRHAGALALVALQVLIALTGNYGFFNLLSAALCVPLLDDRLCARLPLLRRLVPAVAPAPPAALRRALFAPLGAAIFVLSWLPLIDDFERTASRERVLEPWTERALPGWLLALDERVRPWSSINSYGLFRDLTTVRPEVVVEVSMDGSAWRELAFAWKPVAPERGPRWNAPHQPRLDWQMWFAALSTYGREPWLASFMQRLLEGEPAVLSLLPEGVLPAEQFPDGRPRFVRARRWLYRFATPEERAASGRAWTRWAEEPYAPVASLESR
jgi:hypothetical protein